MKGLKSRQSLMRALAYNRAGYALAEAFEALAGVKTGSGPGSWQQTVVLNEVYQQLQLCAECLLDVDANTIREDTRERLRRMCRE